MRVARVTLIRTVAGLSGLDQAPAYGGCVLLT
jgi:hypothetical protein